MRQLTSIRIITSDCFIQNIWKISIVVKQEKLAVDDIRSPDLDLRHCFPDYPV